MESVKQLSPDEIDALKKFVRELLTTREVSGRTRQQYENTARRYFDNPEEALRTSSKATYYSRKAALIFVAAHRLLTALEINDQLNALKSARVLKLFYTYADGPTALAAGSVCPIDAKPKVGKRKSLRGLPQDWRTQMVHAAPSPACRD
jgi:hypothetical protein